MNITKKYIRLAINDEDMDLINYFCKVLKCSPYELLKTTRAQREHKGNLYLKYRQIHKLKDFSIYNDNLHDFLQREKIINELLRQFKQGYSDYTKLPKLIYFTKCYYTSIHLIFCSPIYGLKDYNQFEIKINVYNNLEFCEKICKISDSWLNTHSF